MKAKCPAIISVGRTRFGEHYEVEPENLVEEAGLAAFGSAGIEREDLGACHFSDYFLPITNKIGLEEGFLSELLELNVPMEITRSFSSALSNACNAVQAGKYDLVLVGGMEKMTDRWDKIRDDLMLLEDPWSYYAGCTPEANHELMLRAYIKKYGISGKQLDALSNVRKLGNAPSLTSTKARTTTRARRYTRWSGRDLTILQDKGGENCESSPDITL